MAGTTGTIGTMYECRKNGKIGVLESKDEKFKTLLFRDENGGSFNVTFSTFKSNWRKYNGDKKIETSSQITEKKVEAEKSAEDAKVDIASEQEIVLAKTTRSKKVKISADAKAKLQDDVVAILEDLVAELKYPKSLIINRRTQAAVVVKKGGKSLFEIWPEFTANPISSFRLVLREEIWNDIVFDKRVGDVEAEYFEGWRLKYRAVVSADVLGIALKDVMAKTYELYFNKEEDDNGEI